MLISNCSQPQNGQEEAQGSTIRIEIILPHPTIKKFGRIRNELPVDVSATPHLKFLNAEEEEEQEQEEEEQGYFYDDL